MHYSDISAFLLEVAMDRNEYSHTRVWVNDKVVHRETDMYFNVFLSLMSYYANMEYDDMIYTILDEFEYDQLENYDFVWEEDDEIEEEYVLEIVKWYSRNFGHISALSDDDDDSDNEEDYEDNDED